MVAMKALNYQPKSMAHGLRPGKTRTIGLVIPDSSNLFFVELARAIENCCFQYGYSVIHCSSDNSVEKEAVYLNVLADKQVDGLIFISAGSSCTAFQRLIDEKVPLVLVDRELPNVSADLVCIDNHLGGYLATQYLIGLGHRRIACISIVPQLTSSIQRVDGYLQALREANIPDSNITIISGDSTTTSGEVMMESLLDLPEPPSAVFACNDMMAIGAIRGAFNRNLGVPQDISVVGFDDIPLAKATVPGLTTVAQPYREMAETATDLLIDAMPNRPTTAKKNLAHKIVLKPELVIRDSCRGITDVSRSVEQG